MVWKVWNSEGPFGRIEIGRQHRLIYAGGAWDVNRLGPWTFAFQADVPELPGAVYRGNALLGGGTLSLSKHTSFRLRVNHLSGNWRLDDHRRKTTLRLRARSKGRTPREFYLDEPLLPAEQPRSLLIVMASIYAVLALQPSAVPVAGAGG